MSDGKMAEDIDEEVEVDEIEEKDWDEADSDELE